MAQRKLATHNLTPEQLESGIGENLIWEGVDIDEEFDAELSRRTRAYIRKTRPEIADLFPEELD